MLIIKNIIRIKKKSNSQMIYLQIEDQNYLHKEEYENYKIIFQKYV